MGYLLFAICVMGIIILYDIKFFQTTYYHIVSNKLNNDYTIVFLSDLHNNTFGKNNQRLVQEIKKINPDYILIGGDFVISRRNFSLDIVKNLLLQLETICPVYYANGNHEKRFFDRSDEYPDSGRQLSEIMRQIGIRPLVNQKAVIYNQGDKLSIIGLDIGLEYFQGKMQMETAYIEEAVGVADESGFSILLAHHPKYFAAYALYGADLTLAGHNHGGIARFPFLKRGVLAPQFQILPFFDGGRFYIGHDNMVRRSSQTNAEDFFGKEMIVSRGLGVHTIPIRLWNTAELVVVQISGHPDGK